MPADDKIYLSKVRIENAEECLNAAKSLYEIGSYRSSANRSYYAVFHSMRAIPSLDGIDMKHHSGIISEFRRLYIKTGVFDTKLSTIISSLFDIRTESDYDDFYVISRQEVKEQLANAELFYSEIKKYLLELMAE